MREDLPAGHRNRAVFRVPDKKEIIEFLAGYGIPEEVLKKYRYVMTSNRAYIVSSALVPEEHEVVGLPVCRFGRTLKPTTVGMQFFGKYVTQRVVDITKEDAVRYLQGYDIDVEAERGFVAVRFDGDVLGVGFSDGKAIRNQIPKSKRVKLNDV